MALLSKVFDNAFFQLPLLEGMMYLAVVLTVGAVILGLSRRLVGTSLRPAEYREEVEWRKAA